MPSRRAIDALPVWQAALGVALLAAWEIIGRLSGDTWTSRPTLIFGRLAGWAGGDLYIHVGVTLTEVLTGLFLGTLGGVLAGLLLGRMPVAAEIVRPLIVALYSVPLIALAPLLIMFFGLDMLPKIVLITIVVFFLLFFNTLAGVETIDEDLVAALMLMGSTRHEEFQKIILPATMVWILGGIKVALPYALVAATTAEMLASRRGMGWLLVQSSSQYDMTGLYAALTVLMLLGILVSETAIKLEQWLLRWRSSSR